MILLKKSSELEDEKEDVAQVLLCEFLVIFKNTNIVEHLQTAASKVQKIPFKDIFEGSCILIEFKALGMKRTLYKDVRWDVSK